MRTVPIACSPLSVATSKPGSVGLNPNFPRRASGPWKYSSQSTGRPIARSSERLPRRGRGGEEPFARQVARDDRRGLPSSRVTREIDRGRLLAVIEDGGTETAQRGTALGKQYTP